VWPPPYDQAFDHLHPKDDFFVDNEDAYYTTDLENEDGKNVIFTRFQLTAYSLSPSATAGLLVICASRSYYKLVLCVITEFYSCVCIRYCNGLLCNLC